MRTITTSEGQSAFSHLIEAARQEPITVTHDGEPTVVVMSVADYDRLLGNARNELAAVLRRMRAHAVAQGLTEEKLAELLADDS